MTAVATISSAHISVKICREKTAKITLFLLFATQVTNWYSISFLDNERRPAVTEPTRVRELNRSAVQTDGWDASLFNTNWIALTSWTSRLKAYLLQCRQKIFTYWRQKNLYMHNPWKYFASGSHLRKARDAGYEISASSCFSPGSPLFKLLERGLTLCYPGRPGFSFL